MLCFDGHGLVLAARDVSGRVYWREFRASDGDDDLSASPYRVQGADGVRGPGSAVSSWALTGVPLPVR